NVYNEYGHLSKVQRTNHASSTVFWQVQEQNAAGLVTRELLGNGLTNNRFYDTLQRLTEINSRVGVAGGTITQWKYTHDTVGNVTKRHDLKLLVEDGLHYDSKNRLIQTSGS